MNPILKLYLKTFLLMGLPFGLFTIGVDMAEGNGFNLWKFVSATFFFGGVMSVILVSFHRYRLKKTGIQEITEENLRVSQSKRFTSRLTKTEVIERLKNDPIIGAMKMTEVENGILLNNGMSWKSWGEEIQISFKSTMDSYFEYVVLSRPKLRTTLIDYGRNLENVNRIEALIEG